MEKYFDFGTFSVGKLFNLKHGEGGIFSRFGKNIHPCILRIQNYYTIFHLITVQFPLAPFLPFLTSYYYLPLFTLAYLSLILLTFRYSSLLPFTILYYSFCPSIPPILTVTLLTLFD